DGHQHPADQQHRDRPHEDAQCDGQTADELQYAEAVAHRARRAAEEELEHTVRHENRASGDANQRVCVRLERTIKARCERHDRRHVVLLPCLFIPMPSLNQSTISTQFAPLPAGYLPISLSPPVAPSIAYEEIVGDCSPDTTRYRPVGSMAKPRGCFSVGVLPR